MSFSKVSKLSFLIVLMYFLVNTNSYLLNKQDINAYGASYKVITPQHQKTDEDFFEVEELPSIEEMQEKEKGIFDVSFLDTPMDDSFSKVGLLLPLTGDYSNIGQSMLKAAEISLFDRNSSLKLIIEDTK